MADVVGVVFPNGTKTYYFDPAGLQLSRGDKVVVQTANGPEIGQVVEPPHTIDDAELPAPLKKVTRVATGKDLETQAASEGVRKEALAVCRRLIAAHGLDMKLVGADVSFGGDKITFSFTAEERVDFRGLVADLAKTLKTRIELRQVGAREEARLLGGLGPCGRGLCCTLFPPSEEPVSIRMAKEQNLPLNPSKISGLCGRLMCCLKYEQEQYVQFRKEAPAKGTPVSTPAGEGVVAGYDFMKESLLVKLEDGTTTLIRLDTCQLREDGGLVVVPVELEPVTVGPILTEALEAVESLGEVETAPEELAVVEAEVVLGVNGEPVEVIVAETVRPTRSRRGRGRGRRRGRGRDHRETGAAGLSRGDEGPGGSAGPPAASGSPTGGPAAAERARRKRPGEHGGRRRRFPSGGAGSDRQGAPGSQPKEVTGEQNGSTPGSAEAAGSGSGRHDRPRRRHRPRREEGSTAPRGPRAAEDSNPERGAREPKAPGRGRSGGADSVHHDRRKHGSGHRRRERSGGTAGGAGGGDSV